jgi:hypothetical protein
VFYGFLVLVGLVGVALYVTMFFREVPGFAEQRLGKLEALPPDLGKWKRDDESNEAKAAERDGLIRETRHWFDSDKNRLLFQARYRDAGSRAIVRADDDVVVKRKRIRA